MIRLNKPFFDEEEVNAVRAVLDSGWVAQGEQCDLLEEEVSAMLAEPVVSVSNCTSALYLSLQALGIGKGDEVILPDYTFPATALAIMKTGATPVFVDINENNFGINLTEIENAITDKTRAIIPVHLFGEVACDMVGIFNLAKNTTDGHKNYIHVIEDAACSFGAVYHGMPAGTIGDIGCFSLHGRKGVTCGEGGLVCAKDSEITERIKKISNFGIERTWQRKNDVVFDNQYASNYKLSDISAAIAREQLKKLNKIIDYKIEVAKQWELIIKKDDLLSASFESLPDIFEVGEDGRNIFQSYVCILKDSRPAIERYFRQKGFETGIGTYACHMHLAFAEYTIGQKFPNSERAFYNAISLPIYYKLDLANEWYKDELKEFIRIGDN